jgi:indolepyruvate ferredoxin oxidoreductase alpha subunit
VDATVKSLAPRKPVLCQGCPHRSTFYAIKKVYGEKAVYAGDIGCYTLGIFEPFDMQHFVVSMGSGAGLAHGITKVSDQDVVAFMGDSTFFHAGMPPIANLKFNDGKAPLIVVLDNAITAMTGHQPHPGTGRTGMGETVTPIKVEEVIQGMGVAVEVASAFTQKDLLEKIKKLKKIKGPKVLVSRGECRLLTRRNYRRQGIKFIKFQINQQECKKCGECTDRFSCPAIKEVREKKGEKAVYTVDLSLCWGCSVCAQICPYTAIHAVQEGKK